MLLVGVGRRHRLRTSLHRSQDVVGVGGLHRGAARKRHHQRDDNNRCFHDATSSVLGVCCALTLNYAKNVCCGANKSDRSLNPADMTLRVRFSQEILVQPTGISVQSADEAFVDRVRDVVEEYMADETFNVEAFAGVLSMGPRQLQRKLRALTGQTPIEFIRLMRLKRAAQLLEQQAGTVSEIAYEVGFNHPTYFATCFREVFGTSPSEYAAEKA